MMALQVRQLSVGYGRGRGSVLRDLSFTLTTNECVAIFGQNGSGKSTLLKAIAGLLPVTVGEILLDEEPVHLLPAWERAEYGIGILLQSERVFPEFDVYANVEMGGFRLKDRRELEARVRAAFAMTPIFQGRYREPASSLSGGEQQVLSLLRTLVLKPRLLLLDEPATGLSPDMQNRVSSILRQLIKAGHTILMAEQNVEFARGLADRFYEMQGGALSELRY